VMNNPRIEKCRLDSRNILRYLRHHNYDMDCTKESFERALIFRQNYDFVGNLDFEQPHMQDLLDAGLITVLQNYTKTGERVICSKMSAASPKIPNIAYTGMCLTTQIFEALLDDEENQVRGFHYIFDVSGITLRHYFVLPFMTWFKILKNCEVIFCSIDYMITIIRTTVHFIYLLENLQRPSSGMPHFEFPWPSIVYHKNCFQAHASQNEKRHQILLKLGRSGNNR
jgi:hypothetical protein